MALSITTHFASTDPYGAGVPVAGPEQSPDHSRKAPSRPPPSADSDGAVPPATMNTLPPRTLFEHRLVKIATVVALCVSISLWCSLLPMWGCIVMCFISSTAWHNVVSVYNHGHPINTERLERAVTFWPRGFLALLRIMDDTSQKIEIETRDAMQLLIHGCFGIVFWTVLFFTSTLARWCAEAGFDIATLPWRVVLWAVRWAAG